MRLSAAILAAALSYPLLAGAEENVTAEEQATTAGEMFTGPGTKDAAAAVRTSAVSAPRSASLADGATPASIKKAVPPPKRSSAPQKSGPRKIAGAMLAALLAVGLLTGCGSLAAAPPKLDPCDVSIAAVHKVEYSVHSAGIAARSADTIVKRGGTEEPVPGVNVLYEIIGDAYAKNNDAHVAVEEAEWAAPECGPEAVSAVEKAKDALAKADAAIESIDTALSLKDINPPKAKEELQIAMEFSKTSSAQADALKQEAGKIPVRV